ncbi:MAG: MptD family putative ECF transporter S component [Spirochaetales bacterium]
MKKILFAILLAVIYFAITLGCMFLGFVSPVLWVYQPVISAFLAATPVLIACRNWKKFGAVLIFPAVLTVLLIFSGEASGTFRICSLLIVLAASELVRKLMGYESKNGARLSYAVVSLIPICPILLLWLDTKFYYSGAVSEMGQAYANSLMKMATPFGLILLIALTFLAGYLGAIVSEKIFKDKVELK